MRSTEKIPRSTLVAGITTGLVAAGTIAGALLGCALLWVLGVAVDGFGGFPHAPSAYLLAALAGAPLGGLGIPLLAWTVLRDVPFISIVTGTTLGAALGGTAGLLASGLHTNIALAGTVAGFAAGAVALRLRAGRRRTRDG